MDEKDSGYIAACQQIMAKESPQISIGTRRLSGYRSIESCANCKFAKDYGTSGEWLECNVLETYVHVGHDCICDLYWSSNGEVAPRTNEL